MQEMSHDPAAISVGEQVLANAIRGLAAGAAASAPLTLLAPAGAEEISAQAAAAFATEGMQMVALNASAQEELKLAVAAFRQIARAYSEVDTGAAAALA